MWGGLSLQGLVETVLKVLGLKAETVGEDDNLAALGIDSMQLMEVHTPNAYACAGWGH